MKLTNKSILFFIIAVAAVLRFYDYGNIPYTHDEFSALFRTDFDSFAELLEKGIKTDGHPAGIQVFLYYYTQLFGTEEWVVKLPFTLCGILAILLVYLIGKRWFNESVGLVVAAFVASMQYTIMYSQIARPYISGLFFALAMVYFWTKLVQSSQKRFYMNGTGFVLAASLCTYNHHFSLLFAGIVSVSGLFFIGKRHLKNYLLLCLAVFLLYIPHLDIFFHQLSMGGVEQWLSKPQYSFALDYVEYLFHFSPVVIALAATLVFYGFYSQKPDRFPLRYYLLSLCWFALPLLIGFFYSRYHAAVLQYSVLIFSFPFLLFVFFGHIKNQRPAINLIMVVAVLAVNSLTLVYGRQHYRLFYNSPYQEILRDYQKAERNHKQILSIIDSHGPISEYYLAEIGIEPDFTWADSLETRIALAAFAAHQSQLYDTLFLGAVSAADPLLIPTLREHFPALLKQNNYAGGTTYLFAKEGGEKPTVVDSLDFETAPNDHWTSVQQSNITDTASFAGAFSYGLDSSIEWGPTYTRSLDSIITHRNNFIDISLEVRLPQNPEEVLLAVTLEANGKTLHWGGTSFGEFVTAEMKTNDWISVHHSLKLADMPSVKKNLQLKVFVWNRPGSSFLIDDFKIKRRPGNPVLYGLMRKIE